MPFINGRYYMNPAVGAAIEGIRLDAHEGQARPQNSPDAKAHETQHVPRLSATSEKAIDNAGRHGQLNASKFKSTVISAASANGIDPNLLVGLAARESTLRPSVDHGHARGLYQITPPRQHDLGLTDQNIHDPGAQVPKVAQALGHATKVFHGNTDLAIASWTLGTTGVHKLYNTGGMNAVRGALLDKHNPHYGRVGPDYIDVVKEFQDGAH